MLSWDMQWTSIRAASRVSLTQTRRILATDDPVYL